MYVVVGVSTQNSRLYKVGLDDVTTFSSIEILGFEARPLNGRLPVIKPLIVNFKITVF